MGGGGGSFGEKTDPSTKQEQRKAIKNWNRYGTPSSEGGPHATLKIEESLEERLVYLE